MKKWAIGRFSVCFTPGSQAYIWGHVGATAVYVHLYSTGKSYSNGKYMGVHPVNVEGVFKSALEQSGGELAEDVVTAVLTHLELTY